MSITKEQATVYRSSKSGRRYFSLASAIAAEARAELNTWNDDAEYDENGRCVYPGQCWQNQDNANELFCEELARVKSEYKEQNSSK